MITVRAGEDRGRTRISWLDSRHTFSFGDYFDEAHLGHGPLRVINEDVVSPGAGFPTHGHRDMEILSFVLEGALEHKDSSGGGGVIRPGEIQFMRAGRGVTHSEYNPSKTAPVHFLQIWIVPSARGLPPSYGQRAFDPARASTGFALLASRDGREGSIHLRQDVDLFLARLQRGEERALALAADRRAWVQVSRGEVHLNGQRLRAGDGAAVSGETSLALAAEADAEVLVFDLP